MEVMTPPTAMPSQFDDVGDLSLEFHSALFRRAVDRIARRCDLPRSEVRLLGRMCQGLELGTIAMLYGVDARNVHVLARSVMHKCGVSNRQELLLQFVFMLDGEACRTEDRRR